jgi:eukaryotic-like serine/threonine-protein kinase
VRYELHRSTDGRFSSALIVHNTGSSDVTDWQLEFTFPGRQRVVKASAPVRDWRQSGQTVLLSGPALAPGGSLTAGLSGEYDGTNAFPVQFRLNDTACQPMLVAAATTVSGDGGGDRDGEGGRGHGKGGKKDDRSGPG